MDINKQNLKFWVLITPITTGFHEIAPLTRKSDWFYNHPCCWKKGIDKCVGNRNGLKRHFIIQRLFKEFWPLY